MNSYKKQRNINPDKRPDNRRFQLIKDEHVKFFNVFYAIIGTVCFGFGTKLFLDQQFMWSGIFMIIGGVFSAICGVVTRSRQILPEKIKLHIFSIISLNVITFSLISIGISQWFFIATKDDNSFNVVGNVILNSIPDNADETTWVALNSLSGRDFLYPINKLMYFTITNNKRSSSSIIGLSLEVSSTDNWWKTLFINPWTGMCPVDLSHNRIAFVAPRVTLQYLQTRISWMLV